MGNNAIVYELGLVIVSVVVFWIWQTISLRRDARTLREKEQAQAAAAADPPDEGPSNSNSA